MSVYLLELERGTPFYKKYNSNRWLLPPEEDQAQMYQYAQTRGAALGLHQYEISSYSRGGALQSNHNKAYWKGTVDWLACGTGAASHINGIRYTRPRQLKKYFQFVEELGNFDYMKQPRDTLAEVVETIIMCRLRTVEGL